MKINVEVELTPEEARRLLGLPDLEPMQQRLLEQVEKQMAANIAYIDPEMIIRSLLPVGQQGLERVQDLLMSAARIAIGGEGDEGGTARKGRSAKTSGRGRKRS